MGVPDYYYKIMCDSDAKKSIAHLGHNRADDDKVYEMSVADLEKMAGITLFPADGCGTSEEDTEYWWTESLQTLNLVKKLPEELLAISSSHSMSSTSASAQEQEQQVFMGKYKATNTNSDKENVKNMNSSAKASGDDAEVELFEF